MWADPNGVEIKVQNSHLPWRAPRKDLGADPNSGFPLDFQWFTNTGYLLIENTFCVTGRVGCIAYYVCTNPSLILLGSTKSKPCRTSHTVVAELFHSLRIHSPANQVTNPGQSKKKGKYKISSGRGMWIDKIQVNNLETAIPEDCLDLKIYILPHQLSHHSQALNNREHPGQALKN